MRSKNSLYAIITAIIAIVIAAAIIFTQSDEESQETLTSEQSQEQQLDISKAETDAADDAGDETHKEDENHETDEDIAPPIMSQVEINENGMASFSGTGEENWQIELDLAIKDGTTTSLASTQIDADGKWSIQTKDPIKEGQYELIVSMHSPDQKKQIISETSIPLLIIPSAQKDEKETQENNNDIADLSDEVKAKIEEIANVDVDDIQIALEKKQAANERVTTRQNMQITSFRFTPSGKLTLVGKGQAGDYVRHFVNGLYIGDAAIGENGLWMLNTELDLDAGKYVLLSQDRGRVNGVVFGQETQIFEAKMMLALNDSDDSQNDNLSENIETEQNLSSEDDALSEAMQKPENSENAKTQNEPNEPLMQQAENSEAVTQNEQQKEVDLSKKRPSIIISQGDNLWNLATSIYGRGIEYHKIYRANEMIIQNPDLIYPGQKFIIP